MTQPAVPPNVPEDHRLLAKLVPLASDLSAQSLSVFIAAFAVGSAMLNGAAHAPLTEIGGDLFSDSVQRLRAKDQRGELLTRRDLDELLAHIEATRLAESLARADVQREIRALNARTDLLIDLIVLVPAQTAKQVLEALRAQGDLLTFSVAQRLGDAVNDLAHAERADLGATLEALRAFVREAQGRRAEPRPVTPPLHYFISYARRDGADFADRLHDALESDRYDAWLDRRDIPPGAEWDTAIEAAIENCKAFLFVVTPGSIASRACLDELSHALSTKRPVIPLMVIQAKLPYRIERLQYVDFINKEFRFAMAELRDRLRAAELQPLSPEQFRKNERHALNLIEAEAQQLRRAEQYTVRRRLSRPLPRYIDDVSFKDRQKEQADLVNLLGKPVAPNSRVIGVYGRAGMGKTALVCKVINDLMRGNAPLDGVVPLQDTDGRDLTESGIRLELILDDFAKVLPESVQKDFEAARRDPALSAAHKTQALLRATEGGRYLLLLDNLETLQDAATGALLDADLRAFFEVIATQSQSVQILFTSRERLTAPSLPHLRSLPLESGLPTPDAIALLREGDPDNEAGLRDAPEAQLAQIVERVAGNPRAIEAVIGMLKEDPTLTVAELLTAPDLLSAKAAEIVVQGAIQRLSDQARRLLEIVAIFNKPVPLSAVEYVAAPFLPNDQVAPLLKRLVSNYFLAFNKATSEYAMHPLDRAVHRERVPAGSRSDISAEPPPYTRYILNARAADYYKRLRKPKREWRRYEDLAPQLEEFEHRMAMGDYDTAADLLTDIDFDYLLLWGYARRVAELHERLQGKITSRDLAAISAGNLGSAYRALGQVARAIEYHEAALAIAREIGDRQGEGAWLGNLGNAYSDLGQVARAIEYHEQALAISREIGDRRGEGADLGNLGLAYRALGQVARAIEYYEAALAIAREIGDRRGEGIRLGSLGLAYSALGQVARAIEYYEAALAIAREIGDRRGEGAGLGNLGNAYSALGQVARAIEYHEQALAISREIGDRRGEGTWLGNLGYALTLRGDAATGEAYLREAIRILTEVGDVRLLAWKQVQLAEVLLLKGDLDEAQALLAQARQADVPGINHELAALHGAVLARLGRGAEAGVAFREAVAHAERLLAQTPEYYTARYALALAQAGLALYGEDLAQAEATYAAARQNCAAVGVLAQARRRLEALCQAEGGDRLRGLLALLA